MALKVIVTNHVIEVYEYEHEPYVSDKKQVDVMTNYLLTGDETVFEKSKPPSWLEQVKHEVKQRHNGRAARANFRRLVLQNFTGDANFITLTFRNGATFPDGTPIDITNVSDANKAFDQFMKRLRRRYGKDFKYIVVVEFQDENGRGAVHYHFLADLGLKWEGSDTDEECRSLERWFAEEIWTHGFVDIKDVQHVDNLGAYMSKYMVKRMDDERLAGKKAYRGSRNMGRPLVLRGASAQEIIDIYNLGAQKEVSTNSYESEYLGQITYKQFNLKRL